MQSKSGLIETTIFVYDASGKMVAEYSTALNPTPQVSYLTSDTLGSPRISTNENGAVVSRHDYHPFGEEIVGLGGRNQGLGYVSDEIRNQFTGYERDDETGLDFAQARMYSSSLGRFAQTDPYSIVLEYQAKVKTKVDEARSDLIRYLSSTQQWNRYAYCSNNPFKYVDTTGENLELTGTDGDRAAALQRIKDLIGAKGAALLYVKQENGHYYVDYKGKPGDGDRLAATSTVGVTVANIIDSKTTVEFKVVYGDVATSADGTSFRMDESGGGHTAFGKSGNIQIFVSAEAGKIATNAMAADGVLGNDGKPLVFTNSVSDAHEFGHAEEAIQNNTGEKLSKAWSGWVGGSRDTLIKGNNDRAVSVENFQRQRLGMALRLNH